MTVAIENAPVAGIPGRRIAIWKPSGAVIVVLVATLAVVSLTERGEAAACSGTPLMLSEATLPDLTDTI
ncbi:MAG: hypothetical protein ACTSVG_08730 [Alphaproteobacteria bacterium]